MTTSRTAGSRPLRLPRWPIRAYFFLLVSLFVAGAAAAVAHVEVQTRRDARSTAVADARFAARTAAKQLGDHIALVQATVKQLADNPQITKAFTRPGGCSLTFAGLGGPDRSHVDILRADGTVACSSRAQSGARVARYSSSGWLRQAARPLLVAPTRDSATGATVAISVAPIAGGKGLVAGFVDLESVGPHLASVFGGGHPVEFLVTSRDGGTVIARSIDPGRWVGAKLAGTAFADAGSGVERTDLNGTPRLYGAASVAGAGWKFYVGEDKEAAFAAASRLENRQLVIIVVGLAAVLLAAWLVFRSLVTPLRRLSRALRSTGVGSTPTPVQVSGPAELAVLSEDVNRLIEAVDKELHERQRAEAGARAVLEAALDAIITIDHEGRILEFNPAAESMFGHRREDVLGGRLEELLPPSHRSDFHGRFRTFLATDGDRVVGRQIEIVAVKADGSEFPIELGVSRVPLDGPAVFTGYVRDISGRKRAEGQLRQLAAIVETSRDAIVSRTLDGIVTSWNAAAERLFGYSADEMIGRSVATLAPPDRIGEFDGINDQLAQGEVVAQFETLRVRKDGTLIEVESTISPIMDSSGYVVGASSISRDVTQKKRVEAALRESEARYRDLFENATDLIATVDLDNRLTAVNEAFVRTLEYTREELIGRPLRDLVPPEWYDDLERARNGKMDDDTEATVYEHELLAKSGTRIQVEVASRLIEVDGRPVGTEAICRDITERKQLEEQLRQSQRLESIGRLAGGIAHDFNNLLTVIGGYAEALLADKDASAEPELRQIAAASDRAAILTRQLLAFSRRQVLQPQIVSLNEIVDGITPMLTRLIGEDIELNAVLDPAVDAVHADPNQIEQVLVNLAVNARDAMPQGGRLTLETSNVEIDDDYVTQHPEATRGRHAVLAVTDTGMGMDADTIAHIFEPFFTTKPVGSGTGLGLSTVYGIVKQSGGTIWVYSEPGTGTTFKVYLPAAGSLVAVERPMGSEDTVAPGTETILVVEDEQALRDLAAHMLEQRGYKVLVASSPEDALRIVVERVAEIDLLLTDLVMPQMSGRDLAERVQEQIPTVRVLFMSGYADEAVSRNGALDPEAAFLEKPFSANDLATRVRETLDQTGEAAQMTRVRRSIDQVSLPVTTLAAVSPVPHSIHDEAPGTASQSRE